MAMLVAVPMDELMHPQPVLVKRVDVSAISQNIKKQFYFPARPIPFDELSHGIH